MSTPSYMDGDFTVASAVGPKVKSFPFERDIESWTFTQSFMQLAEYWERLPLDTPDDTELDAFLVAESDPVNDGPMLLWERMYARIPRSRREMETYAYTLPGLSADEIVTRWTIASAAAAGSYVRITTSLPHPFNANDEVIITYGVHDVEVPAIVWQRQIVRTVRATDTSTVDVDPIVDIRPFSEFVWDAILRNLFGRKPFTVTVPSWLQHDYFLPGVSAGIDTEADIPIFEPVRIIDSTGVITDTYGASTTPTKTQYRAQVAAGDLIVVEPSVIKPWMGNIHERVTRYIKAI